jgi:hypothetical protein
VALAYMRRRRVVAEGIGAMVAGRADPVKAVRAG